jgi:hypothetical protein
LTNDLRTIVNGPTLPGLVIYSNATAAYRNSTDKLKDLDGSNATLNDPAGTTTPIQLYFTQTNERIHRTDKLCYFIRDHVYRQTSDSPNLTSNMSSDEAFVWLGHLALPTNGTITAWTYTSPQSGSWMRPGQTGTNENDFYSSSWTLGRQVITLSPNVSAVTPNYFPGPPTTNVDPFSLLTPSKAGGIPIYASRYDVAATTVDGYRQYLAANTTYAYWNNLIGYPDVRYDANPYPRKPASNTPGWMSAAAAQMAPIFVRGCSQFIVEYTGNFVTQNIATGQILSAKPDPTGKIDFTIDPVTKAHKIRWYGFPRDPSDEGIIGVTAAGVQYGVCPLRDTVALAPDAKTVYPAVASPASPAGQPPFERLVEPTHPNYANLLTASSSTSYATPYICAWGPDTATLPQPKMIRITIGIDDPAGHLNSSLTYEYVFVLP